MEDTTLKAYIKDERTGRNVLNPEYKAATKKEETIVVEEPAKIEEVTVVADQAEEEDTTVVASAEESANENVLAEVPEKTKNKKKNK